MKPYPKYKPSGIEWIGNIPEHWAAIKLRRLTKFHKQGFYSEDRYVNEGTKLLRITDIDDNGNINYKDCPYVQISEKDKNIFDLKQNDFVFARSGTIGRFGLVREIDDVVFASYLIRFRFYKSIFSPFLKYYFLTQYFKDSLLSDLHGGANSNVHAENIKDQNLIVPPFKEQQQIASYLNYKTERIDKLIVNKQKQIELLKEERQTVINNAVTKGINPDVKLKPSGIEWLVEIPEHWGTNKLSRIAEVKGRIGWRGYTVADLSLSGVLVIGATQINKMNRIDLSNPTYLSQEKYEESPEIKLYGGEILVVKVGATIGKVALVPNDLGPATINPNVMIIRKSKIFNEYLYYYFHSLTFKISLDVAKSAGAQDAINQDFINQIHIPFPHQTEQFTIVKYINHESDRIENIIKRIEKEIELLQEYRTSLISEVVTGKIDVREFHLQ